MSYEKFVSSHFFLTIGSLNVTLSLFFVIVILPPCVSCELVIHVFFALCINQKYTGTITIVTANVMIDQSSKVIVYSVLCIGCSIEVFVHLFLFC